MWAWLRRLLTVNPEWSDSMLSPQYRPKADKVSHLYHRLCPSLPHSYHPRDSRRSAPPTISITTADLLESGKESRGVGLRVGTSPAPVFRMAVSEEQSPRTGLFTLTNFK